MMRAAIRHFVLLAGVSCFPAQTPYACDANEDCTGTDQGAGICTQGWCAYTDAGCETELRWSRHADSARAGVCVNEADAAAATGGTPEQPTSSGEDCGGCEQPPGSCLATPGSCVDGICEFQPTPEGTACSDFAACGSQKGTCDGLGTCMPASDVCQEAENCQVGRCTDGACSYEQAPEGTACDDGDPCTQDDACDAGGTCRAGPGCDSQAPDDPCQVAVCTDGGCSVEPANDGLSCGDQASSVCCSGSCVDITTDLNNCGGCGFACNDGQSCESVETTPDCSEAPTQTSARCTCTSDQDPPCPATLVCRNFEPYMNLCAPSDPEHCEGGRLEDLEGCPNFCRFD